MLSQCKAISSAHWVSILDTLPVLSMPWYHYLHFADNTKLHILNSYCEKTGSSNIDTLSKITKPANGRVKISVYTFVASKPTSILPLYYTGTQKISFSLNYYSTVFVHLIELLCPCQVFNLLVIMSYHRHRPVVLNWGQFFPRRHLAMPRDGGGVLLAASG